MTAIYLLYNRNCNFIAIILVLNNEVIIFVNSKKISLYYYLFEILAPRVLKVWIRPCLEIKSNFLKYLFLDKT